MDFDSPLRSLFCIVYQLRTVVIFLKKSLSVDTWSGEDEGNWSLEQPVKLHGHGKAFQPNQTNFAISSRLAERRSAAKQVTFNLMF